MNFPTVSKVFEILQILLIFTIIIAVNGAQMTQTKFKKQFVEKSTWLQPQWTNNTIRYTFALNHSVSNNLRCVNNRQITEQLLCFCVLFEIINISKLNLFN